MQVDSLRRKWWAAAAAPSAMEGPRNDRMSAASVSIRGLVVPECEMDAMPVALDSIPRLAPEDGAEDVRTRTAAVSSRTVIQDSRNYERPTTVFPRP
jgi:hypothetical protein